MPGMSTGKDNKEKTEAQKLQEAAVKANLDAEAQYDEESAKESISKLQSASSAYGEITEEEKKADIARQDLFLDWLRSNGGVFPGLYFETYGIDYRGVHVRSDVQSKSVILKVPPKCLITIELAKESKIGQKLFKTNPVGLSNQVYVAAFLLQERNKGESSFWWPYINMLPKSYRHMPALFTDQELKELKGSCIFSEVLYRRQAAQWEYNTVCQYLPEFRAFPDIDFFWARLVVVTRIFGITVKGKKTSAMVPFADMLNHRRPPETLWTYSNKLDRFTITAQVDLKAGQQVYDSYGRKCNTDFFMNYGFVDPDNKANTASLNLPVAGPSDSELYARKKLIFGGKDTYKRRIGTGFDETCSADVLKYMRIAVSNAEELAEICPRGFVLAERSVAPESVQHELRTLRSVAAAAQAAMAAFDTTIAEDEALLKTNRISRNVRNCILCRLSEKRVLKQWIDLPATLAPALRADTNEAKLAALLSSQAIQASSFVDLYVQYIFKPLLQGEDVFDVRRVLRSLNI